jgi:hypothetical protein
VECVVTISMATVKLLHFIKSDKRIYNCDLLGERIKMFDKFIVPRITLTYISIINPLMQKSQTNQWR